MKNTKLIELLMALTPHEFKEFGKFIRSPFFYSGRDLMPLYKILKNFYPDFENKNLNPKYLFEKLFKNEKYEPKKSENAIRVIFSDMYRLGVKFIVHFEFLDNIPLRELFKLMGLRKRKLNKTYLKEYDIIYKGQNNRKGYYDADHLLHFHLIQRDRNKFQVHNNLSKKHDTNEVFLILCHFFVYASMQIRTVQKAVKFDKNSFFDNSLVIELLKAADLHLFLKYVKDSLVLENAKKDFLIYCIYDVLISFEPLNSEYVLRFRDYFYKSKIYFDSGLLFHSYVAINVYYQYYNNYNGLYKLHEDLLADNIFAPFKGREMPYKVYIAILKNLIVLGKTKDAFEFYEKYNAYVSDNIRDSVINLSLAEIEFAKNKYESSLQYATEIKISLFEIKYDIRNLLIRIYYKLNYTEEAISLIDSYKKFLRSNKNETAESVKAMEKFAGFAERLFKLRLSSNKAQLTEFSNSVKQECNLEFKNWIIEETSELIKVL